MGDVVVLSGATGFLGSAIAEELVRTTDARIIALVRPKGSRSPYQRLEALWFERLRLREALGTRIQPEAADIEKDLLAIEPARYAKLAKDATVVIHAAAEVGVTQSAENLWNANVLGTSHMLEFARRARAESGLNRFVHVSTTYVAGTYEGRVPERLFADESYNSLYEKTKHEAELLVSTLEGEVPYAIVRPAQIVGDSRTGFVTTFNTLYYPLKLYMRGNLRVIPASPNLRINMVPVDFVARVCVGAASMDKTYGSCVLNACGRTEELATLGELVSAVRAWAKEHLGVSLPKPIYLPATGISALGRARNLLPGAKTKGLLRNMAALAPYFTENRSYEVANAREVATMPFPDWRVFLPNLLAYATRRGFLNYTDRTVFEQMLMRLRPGRSTSIEYFDVGADGITRTSGDEARVQILRVASALAAHGVGRGTRVATLGVNSVRYFTLDAAIGLLGAINVPIYYTSSVQDVCELTKTSAATLLFVGTDRMLDSLDISSLGVRVVSMSNRVDLRPGIQSWDAFLSCGHSMREQPYVSLDQTETIRYTSGTTGTPKGVVFDQQQVRWMAETMPAVLDWRTRTSHTVRYLSFLPMSHVVEGILVAYAPYYILANIQLYYLNDFSQLVDALPKVRPSIFFSVPRFYEKVWNQFVGTGAGAWWSGLESGLVKRVLAPPLRYVLLRKAGLDKCRQLIVGSASISLELLESFRSLGIEIHNAFGVTEAPLITLSRLGTNELGSVGQLLPSTQVRLDDAGLVYVRGPQVTRVYDGMDEPTLDDEGWFCTGDLGELSPQGNLILRGRKKEIMVTSYGKNIAPQKIEVLLKGLTGVSEAMVVADAKPYVSALLWLEDDLDFTAGDFARLDAEVRSANEDLSHPEQVKRWIVAARPLTVAAGELTPNLKVRRNVVQENRAALLDVLYGGWDDEPVVEGEELHRGMA